MNRPRRINIGTPKGGKHCHIWWHSTTAGISEVTSPHVFQHHGDVYCGDDHLSVLLDSPVEKSTTAGKVKLWESPRQSRGLTYFIVIH